MINIVQSACFVENGELHYIMLIQTAAQIEHPSYPGLGIFIDAPLNDGTEIIVHNGNVMGNLGGTGIPTLIDTSFYTVYRPPSA